MSVWPLSEILGEKSFEFLRLSAKDSDPEVRGYTAACLVFLQNKEKTLLLINLLRTDENVYVRAIAAGALGGRTFLVSKESDNEDPRVVDALIAGFKDPASIVRTSAARSLRILNVVKAIDPLIEMLASEKDQEVRTEAERALKQLRMAFHTEVNRP